MRARRDNDGLGLDIALVGDHDLLAVAQLYLLDVRDANLRVELQSVLTEHVAQFGARCVLDAGPVLDLVRDVDLAAGRTLLQQQDVEARTAPVDSGRHSRGAGSDNDKLSLLHDASSPLKCEMVKCKTMYFPFPSSPRGGSVLPFLHVPNPPVSKNRRAHDEMGNGQGKRRFDRLHYPRYRQAMQRVIAEKSRTPRRKSNLSECPFSSSA